MHLFRIVATLFLIAVLLIPAVADVTVPTDSEVTSLDELGLSPSVSGETESSSVILIADTPPESPATATDPTAPNTTTAEPSPSPSVSPSPEVSISPSPSPTPAVGTGSSPSAFNDFGVALSAVDFSNATISLAGPDALYIRGVLVQGGTASLLFKKDIDDAWKIVQAVPEEKNFFPSGLVFDFARLERLSDGSLQLDGVFVEGKPFSAIIQVGADNSLKVSQPLQAGSLVGAALGRARTIAQYVLKGELDEATANKVTIDENARVNQEMLARIGSLENSNRIADEEKAKLREQIASLEDRNKALDQEVLNLKAEIETIKSAAGSSTDLSAVQDAELKKVLQTLSANVTELQQKVKQLEEKLNVLTITGGSTVASNPTNDTEKQALRDEIKKLSDLNEKLMTERQDIERKLRAQFLSSGYIATVKPDLTRSVLKGFTQARPRIGPWKVTNDAAVQSDKNQYFAQLDLPLVQKRETLLYSFTARSTGRDWAGLGLHIYASGAEKRGYGHGQSLLVWLTRDPDYYKNNGTYLQLYRSDDDVNMGRVLDAAIQEPISGDLKIEVLYQPVDEYITVAVNGIEKIRYKTWFSIDEGVEVSLRSLNTASFSKLEVFAPSR